MPTGTIDGEDRSAATPLVEYYCFGCKQLRLFFPGEYHGVFIKEPTQCGNCASRCIRVEELNSPLLTGLKEEQA